MAFSLQDKVRLAVVLDALRVDRIQLGHGGKSIRRLVSAVRAEGVKVPTEILFPAFTPEASDRLAECANCGSDSAHIFMRGKVELLDLLGISSNRALELGAEAIRSALDLGYAQVWFSVSFATQSERSFLRDLYVMATDAGATGIAIADSSGVALPEDISDLVRDVASWSSLPIGVHCHNDYGLATACTLAGLRAGASWADTSLGGIGERGGNAATEQVAMAARLAGLDVGIESSLLTESVAHLAAVLGRPFPAAQPIVGTNAFAQQYDIHVQLAAAHPELFEPYPPEVVGNRRSIRLGKGSGPHAVCVKLEELGIKVPESFLSSLVDEVNLRAERSHGVVEDKEFTEMAVSMVGRAI